MGSCSVAVRSHPVLPGCVPKNPFHLQRAHMDADNLGNLAAPIHAIRARPAYCLAVAQTDNQLLTQLGDRQGIHRVIETQFPADGRRGSGDHVANPAQAEALGMTDLMSQKFNIPANNNFTIF